MPSLLEIIKQASVDAVNSQDPTRIIYGIVESASPLKVSLDQRITLTSEFLVLTRNVSKYTTKMTYKIPAHTTELNEPDGHTHDIKLQTITKDVVVDNSLKAGDKVIMIQAQGGQDYIILDKVAE